MTPEDGDTLVLVKDLQVSQHKRIRAGTHVTFIFEREVDGRWYVGVPGQNGSLASTHLVQPHEVEPIKE